VDEHAAETSFSMEQPHLRAVPTEPAPETSPLGAARLRRRLTVEEAAARARLDPETVRSLEEGRIYRFPSVHEALATALVYANALGVRDRDARALASLPRGPREGWSLRRWSAVAAFLAAVASLGWFVVLPEVRSEPSPTAIVDLQRSLPPPWEIRVDVFNGTTVPNAATQLANELAGPLAYRLGTVENADRLDYVQTRVYYPIGSEDIAARLAGQLDVETAALPGEGGEPNRLVVIVGRDRAGAP
jgi:LytR cell envelope-related transcriptional attenuator/Helix-turn-helix domain